jgi:hypothetical protein
MTGRSSNMPIAPEARQRLARLMDERRRELRLRWQDVAEAGGISLKTLHNVRVGGDGIAPLTERGIETGLRWETGSIGAVLAGGDPVPAPPLVIVPDSPGRGGGDLHLLPRMSPQERAQAAAHVPAITELVQDVADPDTPGAAIFHDANYPDDARRWDWLVKVGKLRFPGEGYSPELLIWQLAVARVRDDQRRAGDNPARAQMLTAT